MNDNFNLMVLQTFLQVQKPTILAGLLISFGIGYVVASIFRGGNFRFGSNPYEFKKDTTWWIIISLIIFFLLYSYGNFR